MDNSLHHDERPEEAQTIDAADAPQLTAIEHAQDAQRLATTNPEGRPPLRPLDKHERTEQKRKVAGLNRAMSGIVLALSLVLALAGAVALALFQFVPGALMLLLAAWVFAGAYRTYRASSAGVSHPERHLFGFEGGEGDSPPQATPNDTPANTNPRPKRDES